MKTIVVIDDDPIYQMLVEKMLHKVEPGITIIPFLNISSHIQDILKVLQETQNEIIVLLDINVPGMTGWDFMDAFNEAEFDKSHIQVYLVSSSVDIEDHQKSQNNPKIVRFYSKPLYTQDFEKILHA